jgi:hypothetical protein
MKRIYMALALVSGLAFGANAQIDLVAIPIIDTNYNMPQTGKPFSLTGIFDANTPGGDSISAAVIFALAPGSSMVADDKVFFLSPASTVSSQGASGWVYTAPDNIDNSTGTNNLAFTVSPALQKSDSIKTLLHIANFEADSNTFASLLVPRASLVVGNTYGWYGYCAPNPEGAYTDPVGSNNFRYVPIIWGGNTSVSEMLNPKLTPLSIFPNPATDNISFKIEFAKNNESTVARVLDISGRAITTENFGSTSLGSKQYSVNVSKLPAGVYSLQVITDHTISVEKFVKK